MKERTKEGNVLFSDTLKNILFTATWRRTYGEARRSSLVERPLMVRWAVGSIPHGGVRRYTEHFFLLDIWYKNTQSDRSVDPSYHERNLYHANKECQ